MLWMLTRELITNCYYVKHQGHAAKPNMPSKATKEPMICLLTSAKFCSIQLLNLIWCAYRSHVKVTLILWPKVITTVNFCRQDSGAQKTYYPYLKNIYSLSTVIFFPFIFGSHQLFSTFCIVLLTHKAVFASC